MHNNELTTEDKAEFFERDKKFQERLAGGSHQIFRVPKVVNGSKCWRKAVHHILIMVKLAYFAIVDGAPYPLTIEYTGKQLIPFTSDEFDGEIEYSYRLVANNLEVGTCTQREY